MDYSALASAFTLLFLAEMGDKTQLMAMTLAHRYRTLPVVIGTLSAFVLLNLLAVLVGDGLSRLLPRELVLVAAGVLFLVFAYRAWRNADEADEELNVAGHRQAWLISFTLILVAELGDKTQLAMVALAAQSGALWSVFVGGTLALWAVSLLGILVGRTLLRRISPCWIHRSAAVLFLIFGVLAFAKVITELAGAEGSRFADAQPITSIITPQ
ncbi:MAG: TMEM165/GDT1 family protein [Nitrococcus mobilis]|nr:TMEM165/GDT1 family protein [Nitrococcus mobilis]